MIADAHIVKGLEVEYEGLSKWRIATGEMVILMMVNRLLVVRDVETELPRQISNKMT